MFVVEVVAIVEWGGFRVGFLNEDQAVIKQVV